MGARRKATFYVDTGLHKALRMRAAEIDQSPSELLNDVLHEHLQDYLDDLEDVTAVRKRKNEKGKGVTLEQLKKKLKIDV